MRNGTLLTVGITGPTGAGKSVVAEQLSIRGNFPVIDADQIAREVTAAGSPVLTELAAAFGEDILLPDGALDRRELARRAFSDAAATARLNAITHPAILSRIRERLAQWEREGATAVLLDAPTLYESGADALCDRVIAVLARPPVRRARIMARDGISEADARTRMKAGKPNVFYIDRGAYVFCNDGDPLEDRLTVLLDKIKEWRRDE